MDYDELLIPKKRNIERPRIPAPSPPRYPKEPHKKEKKEDKRVIIIDI